MIENIPESETPEQNEILKARVADLRKEYRLTSLDESEVSSNPYALFEQWFEEAVSAQLPEPNAMTLATADKSGRPSARVVLLKGFRENGFIFFTNYESRKGRELEDNPYAALVFFWMELERQVRIEGKVEKVSFEESEAYFHRRPRESQIGAWTSPQSKTISGRAYLEERYRSCEQHFASTAVIPLPEIWGGYLLKPSAIEFWQGRPSRLHDRLRYVYLDDGGWHIERLAP